MASSAIVSIFFLTYAIYSELSTTCSSQSLNYYDADSQLNIIKEWHDMVKTPIDETTAMQQLENEARSDTGKPRTTMYAYLQEAMEENKSVAGLTRAECLVVTMYTDSFYKEYNVASVNKNWQPYKVYTTLLLSAIKKLAKIAPLAPSTALYRGINAKFESLKAKRIFWKTFTSASLSRKRAKRFAGKHGTILVFKPPASVYAAQVGDLSFFPTQQEVLLIPFQAFDFVQGSRFNFSVSRKQELEPSTVSQQHDESFAYELS